MKGTMLPQTKRAIDALKAAGLKRGDFSVQTPYSRKVGGWKATEVTIMTRRGQDAVLENLDNVLAAGFDVKRTDFVNFPSGPYTFVTVETATLYYEAIYRHVEMDGTPGMDDRYRTVEYRKVQVTR